MVGRVGRQNARAREEAEPHLDYFAELLGLPPWLDEGPRPRPAGAGRTEDLPLSALDLDLTQKYGLTFVGDRDHAAREIRARISELGAAGTFMGLFQFGSLPTRWPARTWSCWPSACSRSFPGLGKRGPWPRVAPLAIVVGTRAGERTLAHEECRTAVAPGNSRAEAFHMTGVPRGHEDGKSPPMRRAFSALASLMFVAAISAIAPHPGIAQPMGTSLEPAPPEPAPPPTAGAPETHGAALRLPGEPLVTSPFGPFGAFGPLALIFQPAMLGTVGPPGLYLSPTFSTEEEFTDNVFSTPTAREWDFITRFTPGLTLAYRSEPLTVEAAYVFSSEVYARNSELNDAVARQLATATVRYLPTRLLKLGLAASYLKTNDANTFLPQFSPETQRQIGRQTAEGITASANIAHQFTPRLSGEATYTWARREVGDGARDTSNTGNLDVAYLVTPVDSLLGTAGFGFFDTTGNPDSTSSAISTADVTSQHATAGWTRRFAPNLEGTARLGARVTETPAVFVTPEATLSLNHTRGTVLYSLTYAHTAAPSLGEAGLFTVDAVAGGVTWQILRTLRTALGATVSRSDPIGTSSTRNTATTYGVTVGLTYQVTRWASVRAGYVFYYQDVEGQGNNVMRNVFTVGVDLGAGLRIY
jgi:hypothetical protein